MAEFLYGDNLNAALIEIIELAKEHLLIISPFIKLHGRVEYALKSQKDNDQLKITIVFGKNEDDRSKSITKKDFIFLKDFPNIVMRYEPRLHAKYYANDGSGLLSSMNLYDYSQNNNIEFGIFTIQSFTNKITGRGLDNDAFYYFQEIALKSETQFERVPKYQDGSDKTYIHSETIVDELSKVFGLTPDSLSESNEQQAKDVDIGYCIRTGEKIPFNPDRPFCDAAFELWSKYKNENYQEQYCHYSGERSNGETSKARPILIKNWAKAKAKLKK